MLGVWVLRVWVPGAVDIGHAEAGLRAVLDMWMLAAADDLVITPSSTYGMMGAALNPAHGCLPPPPPPRHPSKPCYSPPLHPRAWRRMLPGCGALLRARRGALLAVYSG